MIWGEGGWHSMFHEHLPVYFYPLTTIFENGHEMHSLNKFSTGHLVRYGENKHEIGNLKILSPPFTGLGLSDLIYKVQVPLTCLTMLLGRKWIEPGVLSLAMQCLPESSRQLRRYCTDLKERPSAAWQATEMPSDADCSLVGLLGPHSVEKRAWRCTGQMSFEAAKCFNSRKPLVWVCGGGVGGGEGGRRRS